MTLGFGASTAKMIIIHGRENDIIEKTQSQFCKQVLGVNKQCPNVACRNELGRLPLKDITNVNIIAFLKSR